MLLKSKKCDSFYELHVVFIVFFFFIIMSEIVFETEEDRWTRIRVMRKILTDRGEENTPIRYTSVFREWCDRLYNLVFVEEFLTVGTLPYAFEYHDMMSDVDDEHEFHENMRDWVEWNKTNIFYLRIDEFLGEFFLWSDTVAVDDRHQIVKDLYSF